MTLPAGASVPDRHTEVMAAGSADQRVRGGIFTTPAFDVAQLTSTANLNPNLPVILIADRRAERRQNQQALQTHKAYFLPFIIPGVFSRRSIKRISERLRPDLRDCQEGAGATAGERGADCDTDESALLRVVPDFPRTDVRRSGERSRSI